MLKDEISLCGHWAYTTQIQGVLVILGTGMATSNQLEAQHIELASTIGHTFVVSQARVNLTTVSVSFWAKLLSVTRKQ